jgi:hypothetical protein
MYYDEISELLLAFGVRQHEIVQRMKSGDAVLKRPSESQSSSSESKRQRMNTADNQTADHIQTIDTMDVQSIPLNVVIELILQSSSFTSVEVWNERLKVSNVFANYFYVDI